MRIRTKIAVIISAISLVLFLAGGVFMGVFFFDMLGRQERLDISNRQRNLVSYIQEQSFTQISTLNDWAKWDDTYKFVADSNQRYIEANLNADSIYNLNVSFLIFLDRSGRDVYSLYYDRETDTLADFPPGLRSAIADKVTALFRQSNPFDESAGILMLGGDRYLYASTAITDSSMTAKPDGVLVFGRKLDGAVMAKMLDLAGGEVSLISREDIPPAILSELDAQAPDAKGIRAISVNESNKLLTSYVMLNLNGRQTGAVFTVKYKRLIYQAGLTQHALMMGVFCIFIVLILLVMTRALHVFVAKPITSMIQEISDIEPSANSPGRLRAKGRGELAQLSHSINSMLDKISDDYREINSRKEEFSSLVGEMKQGFTVHEAVLDTDGRLVDSVIIYANDSFKAITGIAGLDIAGKSLHQVFPETADFWLEKLGAVILLGETSHIEEYATISGRFVEISAYRPQPMQCAILMNDVTERHRAELEREYISYHDQLTGIYNRRYFEEALRRLDTPENLPLSIVIGDLNGLKFTNDAFGHETGDKLLACVASTLREACSERDIVARWGGDEFTMLLPKTAGIEAGTLCNRIRESIARIEINSIRYSMSMGYETKTRRGEDMKVLLKHAEDYMYRGKMREDMSGRGNAIQAIMTTFQEKNEREKEHSTRVSRLCRLIAESMGFTYEQATDMEIAGLVHDIGKIAISDAIINKRGKLTPDEWAEMRRHPEIGCRILCASNEMLVISQYVLAHHERWDGSGYPKGMAGKEIPLQARILAVADSYDAITSMRPYKLKMDVKDAVAELKRCAGRHFDPDIVKAFTENVLGFQGDAGEDPIGTGPQQAAGGAMQAG